MVNPSLERAEQIIRQAETAKASMFEVPGMEMGVENRENRLIPYRNGLNNANVEGREAMLHSVIVDELRQTFMPIQYPERICDNQTTVQQSRRTFLYFQRWNSSETNPHEKHS